MAEFRTDAIFDALKSLLRVIDNEERRKQVESYIDAARLPLDRAILDLLSNFAEAVNGQVSAHYHIALNYRDGALELDVRQTGPGEAADEVWSAAEGEVEKITLRIPGELKELATEAAARAGLSVNSWFVRVLARAVRSSEAPEPPADEPRHGRHGHQGRQGPGQRLSGWVGPE